MNDALHRFWQWGLARSQTLNFGYDWSRNHQVMHVNVIAPTTPSFLPTPPAPLSLLAIYLAVKIQTVGYHSYCLASNVGIVAHLGTTAITQPLHHVCTYMVYSILEAMMTKMVAVVTRASQMRSLPGLMPDLS